LLVSCKSSACCLSLRRRRFLSACLRLEELQD
jgi:hypothetical protein